MNNIIDFTNSYSIASLGNNKKSINKSTSSSYPTDFSDILKNSEDNYNNSNSKNINLDEIFQKASDRYNIPVNLLKAVAKAESNFSNDAISSSGAKGIMQLMPATASGLGVSNVFDPEDNIMGGAKYLAQMLERYDGNTKLALAAYNAGPGNVDKYGGIPPFNETQNYVRKVSTYSGENITAGNTDVLLSHKNISSNSNQPLVTNGRGLDMAAAMLLMGSGINNNLNITNEEIFDVDKLLKSIFMIDTDTEVNSDIL